MKVRSVAGTNIFTASYDPATKLMTWETHNISRTNDGAGGVAVGTIGARSLQQEQWVNVIKRVHMYMGCPAIKSATKDLREFDYDDWNNIIGEEEKEEYIHKSILPLYGQ